VKLTKVSETTGTPSTEKRANGAFLYSARIPKTNAMFAKLLGLPNIDGLRGKRSGLFSSFMEFASMVLVPTLESLGYEIEGKQLKHDYEFSLVKPKPKQAQPKPH